MKLTQQNRLTDEEIAKREADKIVKDKKANEERRAKEKEAIDAKAEAGAKMEEKAQAEAIKAENAIIRRQIKEREEYLATPLDTKDEERLTLLEEIANSGKSVAADLMRELADLRVRSKAKKPDKK